jgi:prepilin-type processing-associated H-X9-DG protein
METSKRPIRYAEFGIILVLLALGGMLAIPLLQWNSSSRGPSCQDNLRAWFLAFTQYADENSGRFPGRYLDYLHKKTAETGFWAEPDHNALYPDYIPDLSIAFCPEARETPPEGWADGSKGYGYPSVSGYRRGIHPSWASTDPETSATALAQEMQDVGIGQAHADNMCRDRDPGNDQYCYWRLLDVGYVYWGWVILGEMVPDREDMREMGAVVDNDADFRAKANPACDLAHRHQDLEIVLPSSKTVTLYYLRQGVERFFITDTESAAEAARMRADIALLWDKSELAQNAENSGAAAEGQLKVWPHAPNGANVLFLDGHVETAQAPQPDGSHLWMVSNAAITNELFWWP